MIATITNPLGFVYEKKHSPPPWLLEGTKSFMLIKNRLLRILHHT